ncbi:reactive intermediate/imine deaminase [Nocardioides aromaticivorans]|uniref:Reactive intermediate/imine deaminase n=1 Tax=Nocardioides aromaticivorans TaxID=200618 RepID=A0A7Y9ZGH7_9ACTN|nr:RidA family protein [Nocardioides aromaticivorans]NYI45024.1 reactive intermediate/imine deaminase [Nocardioides aromaticivorans]
MPLRGAVRAGDWVVVSGQVGHREFRLVTGGMEDELRQALSNLRDALEPHGGSMGDVVKTNILLSDIADFAAMNHVYLEFFDLDRLPARTACAVSGLPFGALVEVEAWAYLPIDSAQ